MSVAGPQASGSRLLQDIPLPPSPEKPSRRIRAKKGKGKGDAGTIPRVPTAGERPEDIPVDERCGAEVPEWAWVPLAESGASRLPPLFTRDGSYFFSIVGSSVKIHSVATGQVVSTLSASSTNSTTHNSRGHSDLITGAVISPDNPFQLITGSLDGCVKIWDFLDATLLQTINLGQPIFHLCAHEKFRGCVFVSAGRPTKRTNKKGVATEDNAVVLRISLHPKDAIAQSSTGTSAEIIPVGKTRFPLGLGLSASGNWLVVIGGHKAYVAQTSSLKAGFTKFVSPERLTCIAFHPSEDYFTTGDDKGNIRSWYCLREDLALKSVGVEKRAQTTTLHWHSHAVSSLAFTPNGAYLLSGGEESVLVIWQLHTGKKEFVPRVGAPITTVAVLRASDREEEYLLGLADASYVFVSSGNMKITRAFSRIKLDPTTSHSSPVDQDAPLAVHTRSSTLLLPSSHPSTLQAYSPLTSKIVSELEVSPSNRVSRREDTPIEPSRVETCVVSPEGDWMATVDAREGDEAFRGEICLKMWWWDWKAGSWTLNSRIDRPHGLHKLTSLAFNPASRENGSLFLVTSGEDGFVKTWRIRSTKTKNGEVEDYWVTRSTFSFRKETPSHASWASDGSLLSVSFGPSVVLYDPISNAIRSTLTATECKFASAAHFIGRSGRFLLVAGTCDLILWDLMSQSVRWYHRLSHGIKAIVPHAHAESFAVLSHPPKDPQKQSTQVLIFRPTSRDPVRTYSLPFRIRNVAWYPPPVLDDKAAYTLVAVTQTWSVVLLGDAVRAPADEGAGAKEIGSAGASVGPSRTLFQNIFGESAFAALAHEQPKASTSAQALASHSWESSSTAKLLDAPAYLMPPLESLFDSVMDGFLQERPEDDQDDSAGIAGVAEEEDEAEGDMEVEEGPVIVGTRTDRVVDGREMGMFIELFRKHAVKASPPNFASHTNGVAARAPAKATFNGVHRQAVAAASPSLGANGASPRPKALAPRPEVDAVPSPLAAAPIGKKRKKSLG